MGKLILLTGDLATGKSTFSEKLSERYKINVFNKDSIKEILGDTIGFANREENLKLSKATVSLMLLIFEQFCKLNKPLILEANFHQSELLRISEISQQYNYEILSLVLRGDTNILHKRFMNRILNEKRHPVHKSAGLDNFEEFCAYIEKSRKEIPTGRVIEVNADDFSYQQNKELLFQIDKFLSL